MTEMSLIMRPACNAGLIKHEPKSADVNEWWEFSCGAQVVLIDGHLEENACCREALQRGLDKVNRQLTN